MPQTLVLTRHELRRCVDVAQLAIELRNAFRGYREDGVAHRVGTRITPTVSSMVLVPGLAPGIPAYTVKVHAKNASRRPAITGVICLHDLDRGDLLAVMDSGWLTAVRTGVGAALGASVLARQDASDVGVIGAGEQGRAQLTALAAMRPPRSVLVYDVDRGAAERFTERLEPALACLVRVAESAEHVAGASDIVLIATWSRTPVLMREQVRPGTHITSLGADEPGKAELDTRILDVALLVTDDQRLARPILEHVDTTLSSVLRNEHPGRHDDKQVTVYSPIGLPLQDCVAAWHAYTRADAMGLGTRVAMET